MSTRRLTPHTAPSECLASSTSASEELLGQSGRRPADVFGVGIGVAAPVEFDAGRAVEPADHARLGSL